MYEAVEAYRERAPSPGLYFSKKLYVFNSKVTTAKNGHFFIDLYKCAVWYLINYCLFFKVF